MNKEKIVYRLSKKKSVKPKILISMAVASIFLLVVFMLVFYYRPITGKASLDVQEDYIAGENISGVLRLGLKNGELLPIDSFLVVEQNTITNIPLNQLVNANSNGTFYVENINIEGEGQGYGFAGKKVTYPYVFFKLRVKEAKEIGEVEGGKTEEVEPVPSEPSEPVEENVSEIEEENVTEAEEQVPEQPVEEPVAETEPAEEEITEQTPETTETPIETADTTESEPITSPLTGAVIQETENIIEGKCKKEEPFVYSLKENQTAEILKNSVEIETSDKDKTKKEKINDSEVALEIIEDEARVSTEYSFEEEGFGEGYLGEDYEFLEINLEEFGIRAEEGTLTIKLAYQDKIITEVSEEINVARETNITEINVSTTVNITEITENTTSRIKIGEPVIWVKKVKLEEPGAIKVKLPKEAENISVNKIKDLEILPESIIEEENITAPASFTITGQAIGEQEKSSISRLFASLTGRAVLTEEKTNEIEITIEDTASEYEIIYETPAPESSETIISEKKKQITISGPDDLYTDVLAYTYLENETQASSIRLYHIENETRVPVEITTYDLNENGLIDYIEWNVPHLSNQTYELIYITKAEHLDSERNFIENIYPAVFRRDNNWTTIPDGHYARVTFEIPLDNKRDITIYAKGNNSDIEVYTENSNELLTKFENISQEGWYKVLLENLTGSYDVFDLRSVGEIEFDYVVDPAINLMDNRTIGYEFINDTVHIWNTQDDYYFNKSSGIQLTNHYQDYWTRNIFCIGYYAQGTWNKIKCADELNGFNKDIQTDNLTYVNATLWKDIQYAGYNLRLGIRYHLGLNDENLSITIYGKNLGVDIPFDLGFAWKIEDWNIPSNESNDKILINNTSYLLNETYELLFKNINETFFKGYDEDFWGEEFLRVDWKENLNYAVKMAGNGNQEDFYIALLIDAGHFNPQQEKSTTFYWIDALVKGTNCGFVTTAPTDDPAGTALTDMDNYAWATKNTAPAGATKVTEIGWWCDSATEEANYEVAIYSHNSTSNEPNSIIGSDLVNAKGTTAGWKRVTGLNIPITGGTVYWIAVQLDNTATGTSIDYASSAGEKFDRKGGLSALEDPWETTSTYAILTGSYAVYGSDSEYPLFYDYWDNNATLNYSGTAMFNVTVNSTNGTVILEINNTNYTASNVSSTTIFNVSIDFPAGSNATYTYRWHSWGNGSSHNYNKTVDKSYTINREITDPIVILKTPPNNNVSISSTVYFAANFTDNVGLKNATLYIWNSSGSNINTTTRAITSTANTTNISVTLPYEGNYTWNYYACDSSDNCAWNSSNWTENYTAPKIGLDLFYPTADGMYVTQNQFFNVTVNVSCSNNNCGEINVSLDPEETTEETEKEIITTIQDNIKVGQAVRWTKKITLKKNGTAKIELPKQAKNITVNKIVTEELAEEMPGQFTNETSLEESINESYSENETVENISSETNITEKNETLEEANAKITGQAIEDTGETSLGSILDFFRRIFSRITGRAITTEEANESKRTGLASEEIIEDIEVTIEDDATEYNIEYYTEAPTSYESEIKDGKRIIISAPDELNYKNVLAFAELPKETFSYNIKLYHLTEDGREEVNFMGYDLNENGLVDYVEWNVPHLSNQIYELIYITKAEHLDENRNFVEDIYEYVKEKDNNWTTIPDEHYARVTFEIPLDNTRDITIYAKGNNSEIEVYTENGEEIIAKFENINEERWYKVLLENLTGSYDVFDLRILGEVEFNYIVDPTIAPEQYVGGSAYGDVVAETGEMNFTHLNVSATAPYDKLVLYYPFDGDKINSPDSNVVVYDWSNNNTNAIAYGNTTVITNGCVYGNCMNFSSRGETNSYMKTGYVNYSTNEGTFSFWYYSYNASISSAYLGIVNPDFHASMIANPWIREYKDYIGAVYYNKSGGVISVYSSCSVVDDKFKWIYLTFAYNETGLYIYKNGALCGSDLTFTEGTYGTTYGNIGGHYGYLLFGYDTLGTRHINASMDEFMFFNASLTPSQISDIYKNQSARFKITGNQEMNDQTVLNISAGSNRVNVTTDFEAKFGSGINLSVGYYDGSWSYTAPQNLTAGAIHIFNVSSASTNLTLNYTFIAGNSSNPFYSPVLNGSVVFDVWYEEEGITKGGLVNATEGATPFYTNESNPRNISLNDGESEVVVFFVNATGTIGNNYTFFAYANITEDLSIGNITSNWSVNITDNIAPAVMTTPQLSPATPEEDDDLNCSFTVSDVDIGDVLTANITWYKNNVSHYKLNMSVTSGKIASTILESENTSFGEIWKCEVTPSDQKTSGPPKNSSEIPIVDLTSPDLTIVSPSNTTYSDASIDFNISANENLSFCVFSLDSFENNYTMTINSSNTGANYTNTSIADGGYLAEFWCNDTSNNVNSSENISFYKNELPTVTLTSPENKNVTTNRTPEFSWTGSDAGGGPSALEYEINITCWEGDSIVTAGSINATRDVLGSDTSYIPSSYLKCLSDNNQNYNWTVRAWDGLNWSEWADERNLSIQSEITTSMPVNLTNFGQLNISRYDNTSDDNPAPLILQNDGNTEVNVSVNFTNIFTSINNPSSYYQFKIRNTSAGCFVSSGTQTTWTNATLTTIPAVNRLNFTSGYQDGCSNTSIDIHLEVPADEPPGNKTSTVTFTLSLAEEKIT